MVFWSESSAPPPILCVPSSSTIISSIGLFVFSIIDFSVGFVLCCLVHLPLNRYWDETSFLNELLQVFAISAGWLLAIWLIDVYFCISISS